MYEIEPYILLIVFIENGSTKRQIRDLPEKILTQEKNYDNL
jgi:hypothetical protein